MLPKPLRTPLLHTLGCELPIMLAGMGGVSRPAIGGGGKPGGWLRRTGHGP